jgi:hypothetical protein
MKIRNFSVVWFRFSSGIQMGYPEDNLKDLIDHIE